MNLIRGKPEPALQCDKDKSLATLLCEAMLNHPQDQISSVDAVTNETITYHQTLEDAITIAKRFRSLEVTKGDVVALMLGNSVHFGSYVMGTLLSGATLIPLNPTFTSYELKQICSWLLPKIIVCTQSNMKVVQEVQEIYHYQVLEHTAPERRRHLGTTLELIDFAEFLNVPTFRHDPVFIFCSSGTTGMPKGVVHTNFSMSSGIDNLTETDLNVNSHDIVLACLPFYHLLGFFSLIGNLYCAHTLVTIQKFKPQVFLNAVQDFRVNKIYIVPTIAIFLAQYEDITGYDLTSLTDLICAGSMLSSSTYKAVKQRLPNVDVRVGYGMTEISIVTILPPFCEYVGSAGKLLAGIVGKVIDLDTSESLPAYKTGELCICSKTNFRGYYRNEKATLSMIDDDGFVHTGDVVYYDDNGDIFVVDRIKELLKYKSFQVSPVELEGILMKHDQVADVGVIGVPNEQCGELPRALIVLRSDDVANNKEALCKELQDFVAIHASPYKQLTGGVYFVPEIPRNASGKILRQQLKNKYMVQELTKI